MLVRWRACKRRAQNKIIVMAHRGRVHGRSTIPKGAEYVNDLVAMVMKMMAIMDAMEVSQRRGIAHVIPLFFTVGLTRDLLMSSCQNYMPLLQNSFFFSRMALILDIRVMNCLLLLCKVQLITCFLYATSDCP
jgi:hypothetical protein